MPSTLQPAMSTSDSAGNLYLAGSYIELGISPLGNFGTTYDVTSVPAGYPVAGDQGVGLTYNAAGFGVDPAIPTIDFFTPGSPFEAFSAGYMAGGTTQFGENYADGDETGIAPTSLTNTSSGSHLSAEWVGVLDGALKVTIDYAFDATDQYFTTKVTLTNVSGVAMDDARYARTVDPDNDEWFVGSDGYTTVNTVVSQRSSGTASEVTASSQPGDAYATATGSPATILYYSSDPGTQVQLGQVDNPFDASAGTVGATETEDDDIALTYDGGPLAAGASTSFTYDTALTDDVSTVLNAIAPPLTETLADDTGPAGSLLTRDASLSGTGTADTVVTLTENGQTLATATVGADGTWSVAGTALGLVDGAHTITASDTDAQGTTATAQLAFVLDTTPPAVSATGILTDIATPLLTGIAEAGATVTVLLDNQAVATTVADSTGAWSYQVTTPLALGAHTVAGQATDAAGNVSAVTASSNLLVVPTPGATSDGTSSTDYTSLLFGQAGGQTLSLLLTSGTSSVQFGDGTLSVGPDTQQAFIARLYHTLLGRAGDTGGYGFWSADATAGASHVDLATGFLGSQEALGEITGLTDTQFVDTLYRNAMERTPSGVETAFWTNALSSGAGRAAVLADIADSPEAKAALANATAKIWAPDPQASLVAFTYETALGRAPDPTGLQFWTNNLKSGVSVAQFMDAFASSDEFKVAHGSQSANAYVTSLYEQGLGRAPAGSELSAFAPDVSNGAIGAAGLLDMVATSKEASIHLATTL